MNHYETLGVAKDATQADIKKAYRTLASKHHPDKEGGDTEKFQTIQAANEILSDENKRARYDAELAGGGRQQFNFNTGGMDHEDMMDILRRQFGVNMGEHFRPRKPTNRNVQLKMQIPLVETLTGQTKTIKVTLPGNKEETLEVVIPRGVQTGQTIHYAGLGDASIASEPRGDLYVQFIVIPDPNFYAHGIDLFTSLSVNCIDALAGCEKEVTGLDGKVFRLNIPAGTQNGTKLRIANEGLYVTDHPTRGNLITQIEIYIPTNLTDEQKEILRTIQATL